MNDFTFTKDAFSQYVWWQKQDKKILKKINELLEDIRRNGALVGIGVQRTLRGLISSLNFLQAEYIGKMILPIKFRFPAICQLKLFFRCFQRIYDFICPFIKLWVWNLTFSMGAHIFYCAFQTFTRTYCTHKIWNNFFQFGIFENY